MKILIIPILTLLSCLTAQAQGQQATLAAGTGKDETEAACGACHSLGYIPMNSRFMAPETWKAEVAKMRNVFGAPIDEDAANVITAYLIARYGVAAKP